MEKMIQINKEVYLTLKWTFLKKRHFIDSFYFKINLAAYSKGKYDFFKDNNYKI